MALQLAVESLDKIEEGLRPLYVEREGKFALDVEGLPDVGALKRALDHERIQRQQVTQAKMQMEQRLAELEAASKAHDDATPPDAVKEIDRLKRAYDERLKAIELRMATEVQQREAAEKKLADTRISDVLRAAALEAGVPAESVEDLIALPKFRTAWKLTPEGEPAPFDGDLPRYDPESPGRAMTAKQYLKEYVQANRHWVPAPVGGSATSSGMPRATGGVMRVSRNDMRDHANYLRIREQAEKTGAQIEIVE